MVKKTYTFTDKCGTVDVYTLENAKGMKMEVSTLGGRILTLTAPDRDGRFADVLMGLARPEDYVITTRTTARLSGVTATASAARNLRLAARPTSSRKQR